MSIRAISTSFRRAARCSAVSPLVVVAVTFAFLPRCSGVSQLTGAPRCGFSWSAVWDERSSRHIDWLPASTASSSGILPFCKKLALTICFQVAACFRCRRR
uniref:Putative secreted protein n=1 Tax=Anopheles darlingi TaxID=43151 RepID=A0A2M4D858_ANODA